MHFLSALLGSFISSAHAATDIWGTSNPGVQEMWQSIRGSVFDQSDLGNGDLVSSFTQAVINFFFPMIGAAAMLLIMYAGLKMVTGQGKDEAFAQAKTITYYALLGVVLAVIATAVVGFIITFLNVVLT